MTQPNVNSANRAGLERVLGWQALNYGYAPVGGMGFNRFQFKRNRWENSVRAVPRNDAFTLETM